jgi:hypothetical protein
VLQLLRKGGDHCKSIADAQATATGVLGPTPFTGLGCIDRALSFATDLMHIGGNVGRDSLNMLTGSSKFNATLLASLQEFDMCPEVQDGILEHGLKSQPYSWSKKTRIEVRDAMHATRLPDAWSKDHTNVGELSVKTQALIGMKTHTYRILLESGLLAELANWPRGTKCICLLSSEHSGFDDVLH